MNKKENKSLHLHLNLYYILTGIAVIIFGLRNIIFSYIDLIGKIA